jgi:transposase
LWFEDESRFGQQGSLTHVWARRGSRPCSDKQTQYQWIYLFAAACPDRGDALGYLMPTADTFCMNLYLDQLSKHVGGNVHVVMVLDQAGWHRSKGLEVPPNISLIELPPYSPELNPIELVWLYLKNHYLSNRIYSDLDALYQAATDAWNETTSKPELIRSLCNRSWTQKENLN